MRKLLPLLILLLAACAPAVAPAVATAEETIAPATATLRVTATATQSTPLETDLAKSACMSAGGEIESYEIDSDYLDAGLRFRVYAPPCYAEQPERNFPVLYLIHGQTYNDDQWDRLGADEAADELIASGEVAPFIIVMPYNISSAQPAVDKFGEAVIEELLPWVEENSRTLAEREGRAVGGLSRGASWAIHFGLTHPELFGAMAGHSPPVFVEDAPQVRGWLDEIPAELMPRIWLDIGERDQEAIMSSAIWFEGLLTERNIAHEWYLFSGFHDEAYWSSHVEMYLRWYAADW
jgi:enterochelin esterase-like enzyme